MAWVVERKKDDGTSRFLAQYRDPEGRIRSAGTHSSRRAAERAGNREEQQVHAGSWFDRSLGAIPFQQYVEKHWLPSKHIEATTLAAYCPTSTSTSSRSSARSRCTRSPRLWCRTG